MFLKNGKYVASDLVWNVLGLKMHLISSYLQWVCFWWSHLIIFCWCKTKGPRKRMSLEAQPSLHQPVCIAEWFVPQPLTLSGFELLDSLAEWDLVPGSMEVSLLLLSNSKLPEGQCVPSTIVSCFSTWEMQVIMDCSVHDAPDNFGLPYPLAPFGRLALLLGCHSHEILWMLKR